MILHPPFEIGSRLLPALRVGQDGFISLLAEGQTSEGRTIFRYFIDTPRFEHEAADLNSGVGGCSLQSAFESLLSFLGAANEDLFPANVVEWAYQHSDEIGSLHIDLEETPNLITTDETKS